MGLSFSGSGGGSGGAAVVPKILIAETDAGLSVSNGTFTTVAFEDTIKNDFSTDWDGSVLTNNDAETRYFKINCTIDWSAGLGSGAASLFRVYKNGSTNYHTEIVEYTGTGDDTTMNLSVIIELDNTDTVEIKVYQTTGSSKTLSTTNESNRIYITEIV